MARGLGVGLAHALWATIGGCSKPDGAPPWERALQLVDSSDAFSFAATERARAVRTSAPPEQAALAYLDRYAALRRLPPAAASTAEIARVHDIGGGGRVVQMRQVVDGYEVYGQRLSFLLDRNLDLIAVSGGLHRAGKPGTVSPAMFSLGERPAVAGALGDVLKVPVDAGQLSTAGQVGRATRFRASGTLGPILSEAAARPVLFPTAKQLVPAYAIEVEIAVDGSASSQAYAYVVRADDGSILERRDLTFSEAYTYQVWADEQAPHRPLDGPHGDLTPHPTGDVNTEIPVLGTARRRMVTIDGFNTNPQGKADPWLPAGADKTDGNNVRAYADHFEPNGFSENDVFAALSAPGTFAWPFLSTASPIARPTQVMTSVTQIFFTTNWLHDWYYDSGFTETAGNAQDDNYGRGGEGGDPLLIEGQDTRGETGRNNANMSTPSDGLSPRMQMYLWDGDIEVIGETELTVTQPTSLAGDYEAAGSSFGIDDLVSTSGSLALIDDGGGEMGLATDGCEPIQNAVTGKIAVIDRGNCAFVIKATNAATAGAIGVIVINNDVNQPDSLPPLGGSDATLTIPVVGVSLATGDKFKQTLASETVAADVARAGRRRGPDRDGTIDNSIVAHEWGHYIHHRLTFCGSKQCSAESEGWGDFVAIHLHVREGDNLDGVFAKATWSTGDAYFGIRRVPYSVDFTKNALTLGHIADSATLPKTAPINAFGPNSEVHNAGEVWTTMLFEAYVALLKESDRLTFAEAQRRMSDYIVAGMMMAPAHPTYTEQRDAILAAAAANDRADLDVMARAFARRGAGTGAVSPPRDSGDFEGVEESFIVAGDLAITGAAIEIDEDCDGDGNLDRSDTGALRVSVVNAGPIDLGPSTLALINVPPGVSLPDGNTVDVAGLRGYEAIEVRIPIAMETSLAPIEWLTFEFQVENDDSFHPQVASAIEHRVNYDDAVETSASDDVESNLTSWQTATDIADEFQWRRVQAEGAQNMTWHADDPSAGGEQSLESPTLSVGSGPFVVRFEQRYKFEASEDETGIVYWDGGVIEVSVDGGETWNDVSQHADPGYGGVITDESENPLSMRQALVGQSEGWPEMTTVELDFGTELAGKQVKLRFRLGSDAAVGDAGWDIDNVEADGITNLPFSTVIEDGECSGGPSDPGSHGGGCAMRPAGTASSLLIVALGLLFLRRRRRGAPT